MTARKRWTLVAVILGSGIVFLDSTVVNVALPKIGQQLRSHLFGVLEGQSYVYNGYLLTLSAFLILAGALSDYYGRRRMFVLGLVGFGLTSAACGLAPNLELDRKSTRLNSSHEWSSYAVFCLKKKTVCVAGSRPS